MIARQSLFVLEELPLHARMTEWYMVWYRLQIPYRVPVDSSPEFISTKNKKIILSSSLEVFKVLFLKENNQK